MHARTGVNVGHRGRLQWRIQDLSEGQAQPQDSKVNMTSKCIRGREAIARGRSPRFAGGGVRVHAPQENFENRDAQICVFSPFGSIIEPE